MTGDANRATSLVATQPQPGQPQVGRSRQRPRTCVGCRARDRRSALLRLVVAEVDGVASVVLDPDRVRLGRGAWLHPDLQCLSLAERRAAFPRALRWSGPLAAGMVRIALYKHNVRGGSGSEADEQSMSSRQ